MNRFTITDVRANPGDAAFLIDDGKTAIMYDSGFAFTGYKVAEKIYIQLPIELWGKCSNRGFKHC